MKQLPLDNYPPLAQRAIPYLENAKTTYETTNRKTGSWVATYYSLSHAIELSIKAVVVHNYYILTQCKFLASTQE